MREAGKTYEEIRVALGYRTVGAVKMAVSRLLARNEVESVADYRRVHGARLERLLRACWDKACAGDAEAIRTARPLLDSIAKLHGLDAAMQIHVRPGISEAEFAEQARQLLEVTGPGPLYEMAGLAPPEPPRALPGEDGWSNIGVEHELLYSTPQAAPGAPPASAAPEPFGSEPQAIRGIEADQDTEEIIEEVEEVVAEIVGEPLPPSQRRVPADLVDGVPRERTGVNRRLAGFGTRGYNPLIYSGWSEVIFPS
jgi:hypothetical protein